MPRARSKPRRGVKNRIDGRQDYVFDSSIWTGASTGDPEVGAADFPSLASLPVTTGGKPYLPIDIYNNGSPGIADSSGFYRNDDDDGLAYDVLIVELDEAINFGFEQEVYFFKEAPVDPSSFSASIIPEAITLQPGSGITTATIIITDSNSPAVRQGTGEADDIIGNEGGDGVYAYDGDDVVSGLEGYDTLLGGEGDDLINGGSDDDYLGGNAGDDWLLGEAGDDFLNGFEGQDTLYGGSGNDQLFGWAEDDILYGGSGNDQLYGEEGVDTLYGGSGNDTYYLTSEADAADSVIEFANQGEDSVEASINYTLPAHVENLILVGAGAIVGVGNELDNEITRDDPFDVTVNRIISAGGGNDRVITEDGNNQVNGDAGDDQLFSGTGDDILNGGDGNDTLNGNTGDDTLNGGNGNDVLFGGFDTDVLDGGAGDDFLIAHFGADTLTGGEGVDIFAFTDEFTTIDTITDFNYTQGDKIQVDASGFGVDATESSRFTFNNGTGVLSFDGIQFATLPVGSNFIASLDLIIADFSLPPFPFDSGSSGDSVSETGVSIVGTAIADQLIGTEGNDSIAGNADDDVVFGLEGNDNLLGGTGNDLIDGGTGNDQLSGEAGDDRLYGEVGNDTLNGGDGNDTLNGGTGNDLSIGGTGSDRFNFYHSSLGGVDTIADFNPTEDAIGLYIGDTTILGFTTEFGSPVESADIRVGSTFKDAGFTPNASIAAGQFHVGSSAIDAGDRLVYDNTTGALFFDVDGTGATAQVQIATLTAGLPLTHTNIVAFDDTNVTAPPTPTDAGDGNASPGVGTAGNDTLIGTPGKDTLVGLNGNDRLLGKAGNDILKGGRGNDFLRGDAGNDILIGGVGNDTYLGGAGRDIFALEKGAGRDLILDFKDRQDRFGLSRGIRFRKLTIAQKGRNTLISLGKDQLALVRGVKADLLTAADFIPLPPGLV